MPAMSESPTPPDIDRSSPESKHLEERRGPARPYTPPNDPNSPRRDSRGRADFSPSLHIPRRNTHVIVRPPIVESYRGRDSSPVRTEYGGDEDDTVSVRSALATRTLKAARPSQRVITKSQKISSIQNVFSESQKIAYVGLCYLSVVHHPKADVKGLKKANDSYSTWADHFMEKLYVFLDIKSEERSMIKSLAEHGLVPSDLSKSLIDDAKKAAAMISERQEKRQRAEEEAMEKGLPFDFDDSQENGVDDAELTDIRFTILTHLFILCIMDGQYDSRSRTVLRSVAQYLEIPWADVVRLEGAIADQLRIYEDSEEVKGDVEIVGKRNRADTKNRWLFTGIATLAGGAVIGLTAGLAAPLIAGGIGVALGTFGVTGATAALSTTGALALITTGGVLTGGVQSRNGRGENDETNKRHHTV
ncbi:uncharacterized protein EV422DRAFT_276057 [Fimicolochytrium jonesii]|uniref:uncharacterized protein n=1 Tax=Fimicolochytrium jonesii TaxID=1396493 RepID=UPI0022FDF7EB|nr:uncharacterized protein EV422DRAFT_276057 [Fimicolochytrium jonesii]KAI8816704.1 hypothetical protein EV422DRAFT_276057 [Fimicolochytrium jonesii]